MKRWLAVQVVLILASCSTTPTPTPTPNPPPSTVLLSTVVPIPTLLPTVTLAPTLPIDIPTATPVAPRTPPPASAIPSARTFSAPVPVEPNRPALFKDGNDIRFTYEAVGRLQAAQCYLLHVEMVNPGIRAGNRGDDFIDVDNCGDAGPGGKRLAFVLYRGRFRNSPNYGTILQQALGLSPEVKLLQMTWSVMVVQNNGRASDGVHYKTVPLSPASPTLEFDFQP